MALSGIDYTEPRYSNGSSNTSSPRRDPFARPGNGSHSNGAAHSPASYSRPVEGGKSEYVVADHLEYWHKLQPSATVADAAISDQRGTAGGQLQDPGNRRADTSFRQHPVAWGLLFVIAAFTIANLVIQISDRKRDFFSDTQSVWAGCNVIEGRIDCR